MNVLGRRLLIDLAFIDDRHGFTIITATDIPAAEAAARARIWRAGQATPTPPDDDLSSGLRRSPFGSSTHICYTPLYDTLGRRPTGPAPTGIRPLRPYRPASPGRRYTRTSM